MRSRGDSCFSGSSSGASANPRESKRSSDAWTSGDSWAMTPRDFRTAIFIAAGEFSKFSLTASTNRASVDIAAVLGLNRKGMENFGPGIFRLPLGKSSGAGTVRTEM